MIAAKKPRPEVVDVDALDSDDDADDNGERGLGPPRVVKAGPPRALAVKPEQPRALAVAQPCPPQRPVPKPEPRGPPVPVKPEPKKEVKPKVERKPKVELDDDGTIGKPALKKKKKKAPAVTPSPARLSEDGSDDDEPAEPPPPRSAFPQWLKAREDKGEAPPLDPDQRRACDCIVVQSKNTFVTGSGGNGKSHVTRTILDFFEKHYGARPARRRARRRGPATDGPRGHRAPRAVARH